MRRSFLKSLQFLAFTTLTLCVISLLVPGLDAMAYSYTGFAPSDLVHLLSFGTDSAGIALANSGVFVKVMTDPKLHKKWSAYSIKQGERPVEFDEIDIGMGWGKGSPTPSKVVKASPIKWERQLEKGGRYIDTAIKLPLVEGTAEIINAGVIAGQKKIGSEGELNRQNFRCLVGEWSYPVKETDIVSGEQDTYGGSPELMVKELADSLADLEKTKLDLDLWFAAFTGNSEHIFREAAKKSSASNGTTPVKNEGMGLMSAPTEPRNTYVWRGSLLNKVTYSSTPATFEANITTSLSAVTKADRPTKQMFDQINRLCVDSDMIPCVIKDKNMKDKNMYLVYVPGDIRDLAERDEEFKYVFGEGYSGAQLDSPLLNSADVVYKNLVIRSSSTLNRDDYFSAESSFNAIPAALTDTPTKMLFNKTTNAAGNEVTSITPGVRQFTAATQAVTDFGGQANTNVIRRIVVMGAAGMVRATGKKFALRSKNETDYDSEYGIAKPIIFGHARVEHWAVDGTYKKTPQMFQVYCLAKYVS